MPIFMLVSGYCFYTSLFNYSSKNLLVKKTKWLVYPIVTNGILIFFQRYLSNCRSMAEGVHVLLYAIITFNWYFYALWLCSLLFVILRFYKLDNLIVFLLLGALFVIIPDYNLSFFTGAKFLYPYFVLGYYARKCQYKLPTYAYMMIFPYVFLLLFYTRNDYVYNTGMNIYDHGFNTIINILYRWGVGIVGCISIIGFFQTLPEKNIIKNVFSEIGRYSFHIYYLNGFVFYLFESQIIETEHNFIYLIFYFLVISAVLVSVSIFISRSKILSRILFGR